MFKPAKISWVYLSLGFVLSVLGCATQSPSTLQPTDPSLPLSAAEGSSSTRLYYEGDSETVSPIDAGIAFALAQGITEPTAIVSYVEEILRLPITPEDLTVSSPLSLSDFDGDGVPGTATDAAILYAISQGFTNEARIEGFCQEVFQIECPIQDGFPLPGGSDGEQDWILVGPAAVTGGINQFRVDYAFGGVNRTLTVDDVTLQGLVGSGGETIFPIPFGSFEGLNQRLVPGGGRLTIRFSRPLSIDTRVTLTDTEGTEIRALVPASQVPSLSLEFVSQYGTAQLDRSEAITLDFAGNVYLTGFTEGNLGAPNVGGADIWLSKLSPSGDPLWIQQIGTPADDISSSVALDRDGNIYISGSTDASLGGLSAGGKDIILAKFDPTGQLVWIRQLGSRGNEFANFVATDPQGSVYITGPTSGTLAGEMSEGSFSFDVWVAKYDSDGELQWLQQAGTEANDFSLVVATDQEGNLLLSGYTEGDFGGLNEGGQDSWVAKYSFNGQLLWVRQLGTEVDDFSTGVVADADGNVFTAGRTLGTLGPASFGGTDAWLAKYDSGGQLLWTQQTGTPSLDRSEKVSVDLEGNAYLSGYTTGNLGMMNRGFGDAWAARFDPNGSLEWVQQLGGSGDEVSEGIAIDRQGNVYLSGFTNGDLGEDSRGGFDAWLAKIRQAGP